MNNIEIVKEMLWLAWLACDATSGMGWLQNKPNVTKEDIWKESFAK